MISMIMPINVKLITTLAGLIIIIVRYYNHRIKATVIIKIMMTSIILMMLRVLRNITMIIIIGK